MVNFQNVVFSYRGHKVFDGLNLTVARGGIYGLLGRNGAGKTTMLRLASGLLKPKTGRVTIENENPFDRNPELLSKIFIVAEEFSLPSIDVMKYAEIYGAFYPKFSAADLENYLKILNVEPHQNMAQMSFGQKKKAYIAFALACNTELLLMDEPTNGLDIPSKGEFRRLLSSICDDSRAIIISIHQVRDLDQLIDSVIILEGSQILLNASCAQITQQLQFTQITDPTITPLYAESSVYGTVGVVANTTGAESALDMELLFNAVIAQPQQITKIFNRYE